MAQGRRSALLIIILALVALSLRTDGQQCSSDHFSIGYNGVTAFEVSNIDNSCRCTGAVTSESGISRVATLTVDNLLVVNSTNLPCPSSCQAQIATQAAQIAVMNATLVALQATLATLLGQGCGGGGTGGTGGGGASGCNVFCTVVPPADGYAVGLPKRVGNGGGIAYACNGGFNLTGFAAQSCVGGEFDHDLPVCVPLPCNAVPPANGAVSAPVIPSGSTVTYSCNAGYVLSGMTTQRCYASLFNSTLPTCVGQPCSATAPANGNVSAATIAHASNALYSCLPGYTLSGPSVRTCTATVLSGSQPACNGNPCPLPTAPAGTASTPPSGSVAHGSPLVYTCNSGYSFTAGNLTRNCFAGALDGTPPTCTPDPCTATAPGNGTVTATSVPHGGSVTYSCNSGFFLAGVATQTCSAGSMSSTQPTCITGGRNCLAIKQQVPSAISGIYVVDPDGPGGVAPTTVFCEMTADGGGWASIFTVSLPFTVGTRQCMFNRVNDDMDSTIMWVDLSCKISSVNADNTDGAKYMTVTRSGTADASFSALTPRPAGINTNARPCPLPASQKVVWFDWQANAINWGTGSTSFASVGMGSFANCYSSYSSNYVIIGDGVDMILTGCATYGNRLLRFNFETNTVTASTVSPTFAPQSNSWQSTEQDEFGVVLFTVNGKIFYYNSNANLALGGTLGNPNAFTWQNTVSRPLGADTQFNIDLWGWVDLSRRLWLADWGHDNGGYFACGDDNQLGTAQTNVRLTY